MSYLAMQEEIWFYWQNIEANQSLLVSSWCNSFGNIIKNQEIWLLYEYDYEYERKRNGFENFFLDKNP